MYLQNSIVFVGGGIQMILFYNQMIKKCHGFVLLTSERRITDDAVVFLCFPTTWYPPDMKINEQTTSLYHKHRQYNMEPIMQIIFRSRTHESLSPPFLLSFQKFFLPGSAHSRRNKLLINYNIYSLKGLGTPKISPFTR